jgi:hypothetical protein
MMLINFMGFIPSITEETRTEFKEDSLYFLVSTTVTSSLKASFHSLEMDVASLTNILKSSDVATLTDMVLKSQICFSVGNNFQHFYWFVFLEEVGKILVVDFYFDKFEKKLIKIAAAAETFRDSMF